MYALRTYFLHGDCLEKVTKAILTLYSADTREKASSVCVIPKVCDSECEANVIEEDAVEGFDARSVVQSAEHDELLSNNVLLKWALRLKN